MVQRECIERSRPYTPGILTSRTQPESSTNHSQPEPSTHHSQPAISTLSAIMASHNSGPPNTAVSIRPQQIDSLPYFSSEQKQHYKNGLAQLWQTLENTPQGSPQHQEAENKIKAASMKIMQHVANKGSARPTSGGGPPRPNPNQLAGGQGGMPMQQQGSQQPAQPQQAPQQTGQQGMNLGVRTQQEIRSVKINFPAHAIQQGEGAMQNYRKAWMQRAAGILQKRDQAFTKGTGYQNSANQKYLQQGQAIPREVTNEIARLKEEMTAANSEWENMKRQNAGIAQQEAQGMQRQHSAQGQAGNQQQVNGAQEMQRPGTMQGVNNPQQGDGSMNVDQNNSRSPLQPQGSFQLQPQNHVAPSPAHQNIPQQPPSAHPQQTPQTATQSQPPQNFPPNSMPQQQQPNQQPRPQMNPQQMQQHQQSMAQQQHQPTPASGVPQSAGGPQQPQQRPQPLTHQAAISQAADSYSRQQAQQQQQSQNQVPQLPNGSMALNGGAPPSATQQTNTPSSAYPQLSQNPSQSGATNKFPIPKQLTLDPRTQMPVAGPPSRPTFSNAGMMSQPGVPRPAQFTLEGEGDRVLSKRKLDELVRQVTGSTASASAGDDSGENTLAPDVEEAGPHPRGRFRR